MAKRAKRRGMRKAYLKRFSAEYINTGRGPSSLDKSGVQARCTYLFRYGEHSNASQPFIDAPNPRIGLDDPKLAIERRLEEQQKLMQGPYLQRLHTFNYVYMYKGKHSWVRMYFSGNEAFFVASNDVAKIMKRSIIYDGRSIAAFRYKKNRVTWVETVSTATAE